MEKAALRLKVTVGTVKKVADNEGNIYSEELSFNAVYSNEPGSANAQWSKWTPSASLSMTINNPAAFGKVLPGQFFFVDLIPTTRESI